MLPITNKVKILITFLFITNIVVAQKPFVQTGEASYYADKFEGRKTANGEIYRHNKLTAAHRTLAFGTKLKVTNLSNGKSVMVTVNDRGPFVKGRIIDLSKSAATKLGYVRDGVAKVKIETVSSNLVISHQVTTKSKPKTPQEYYQIEVNKIELGGYGIQVGSFSQMDNLIHISSQVKAVVGGKYYVKVAQVNGMTYNRLIVGVEKDKKAAERHLKALRKTFPDCFVVQL